MKENELESLIKKIDKKDKKNKRNCCEKVSGILDTLLWISPIGYCINREKNRIYWKVIEVMWNN